MPVDPILSRPGRLGTVLRQSSEDLLRLLALDPADTFDRGRREALRRRLTGENAQLANRLLASLDPPVEAPPSTPHPMVLEDLPPRRSLGPGDVEFLRQQQGKAPWQISADDARIVAELEAAVETSADRRLVEQVARPLRRHLDRQREEAQLRAVIDATAQPVAWASIEATALSDLTEHLVAEAETEVLDQLEGRQVPRDMLEQFVADATARARLTASDVLRNAWQAAAAARGQRKSEAQQRLAELARGADPKSSAPVGVRRDAVDAITAGRDRAREDVSRRPSSADLYETFGHDPSKIDAVPGSIRLDEPMPAASGSEPA